MVETMKVVVDLELLKRAREHLKNIEAQVNIKHIPMALQAQLAWVSIHGLITELETVAISVSPIIERPNEEEFTVYPSHRTDIRLFKDGL